MRKGTPVEKRNVSFFCGLLILVFVTGCAGSSVMPPKGYRPPKDLFISHFKCCGVVPRDVSTLLQKRLVERFVEVGTFSANKLDDIVPPDIKSIVIEGELSDLELKPHVDNLKSTASVLLSPLSLAGIKVSDKITSKKMKCYIACRVKAYNMPERSLIFLRSYTATIDHEGREFDVLVNKKDAITMAVDTLAQKIASDFCKRLPL